MTKWIKWIILFIVILILIFIMADYTQIGYNDFLLRPLEAGFSEQIGIDSTAYFDQISGNQVRGDKITSKNGSLVLDLENDSLNLNEGKIKRIEIGRISNDTVGAIFRDNLGTALLNITGDENFIQSANQKTFFNLSENKMQIADDKGTTIIDGTGLVSTANFPTSNVQYDGLSQQITDSTKWTNITGGYFTFSLDRTAKVIIVVKATFYPLMSTANRVDCLVRVKVDNEIGTTPERIFFRYYKDHTGTYQTVTSSLNLMKTLSVGTHELTLQGTVTSDIGSPTLVIYDYYFYYLVLGT